MKRETGVNPVQGRCCVGVAVAWKSLGEVPEKRSSCVGCQSQKTCLYITHVRLPGTGSVPKQRRSAACWRCSAKRTLILCVRTRRQSVTSPLFTERTSRTCQFNLCAFENPEAPDRTSQVLFCLLCFFRTG